MDYTHLTAYSQQPVELFSEDPEIVRPAISAVYSDPDKEDTNNDAVDPYASQQIYDAYAAEFSPHDKVYEDGQGDAQNSLSDIKESLQTTYASADPYFEAQIKDNDKENEEDEDDSSDSEEDQKSGASKSEPTSFSVKDWNAEFQQLLQCEDDYEKFVNLGKLAQEFVYTAQTYGRVIISELSVPVENKTIKPTSIGGAAGGEKYIVNGILFKFALDFNGIYGGDENAAKAAGHDLKGSIHFFLAGEAGLHLPLMALINYMGFCLVAMSLLPISSKTLKYGSSDSGVNVHVDDDILFNKMANTAKRLNLKGHYVGALQSSLRLIYGPGDLEGHAGNDGRYYVIDFARLFPPEAPIDNSKEKGRILYKLLRPELVASNSVPLSSDAFTGWSVLDKQNCAENNKEVLECTKKLLFVVIPAFAEELKSRNSSFMESLYVNIPSELHRYGINVRYAGHVRRLVRDSEWNQTLLIFIISRTVSSIIRKKWRKIISTSKYITEQKCKEIAIDIINHTFISSMPGYKEFVTGKLRKIMNRKFKFALFDDENTEDFDFIESCFEKNYNEARLACLKHIATQLGLELTTMGEKSISVEKAALVRRDIVAIHPRVKHMNVIDMAEAQEMLYSAINGDGAKAHFEHVIEYFNSTIKHAPHLVKYQLDFVLKGARTYRKRAKTGVLNSKTVSMNAAYLATLIVHLSDTERDPKTKFLLALERCKMHRLGILIANDLNMARDFPVYTAISALNELDPDGFNAVELYLDYNAHCYHLGASNSLDAKNLAKLFEAVEEKFKDDTRFQLVAIRYYLFRSVFFDEDHSAKIIELFNGIQKPDQYLPKLLNNKKLAFLNFNKCDYPQFGKILKVAASVTKFTELLRKIVATERKISIHSIDPEHFELLKTFVPEAGFVSLKINGVEQNALAIDLLSHYLSKSSDLTYLEMEGFPDLPPKLIECIQNTKKIKHLKLLQVGPAEAMISVIKSLAPNLESFAHGETDLSSDQFLELLACLPVGLKELRLSSVVVTKPLLAAPELSELLNNVLEMDLTNCTALNTEAVAMLVELKNLQKLVLTGCTGISDQDFYATVYTVKARSLMQIVTHHGNADLDLFNKAFSDKLIHIGDVLEYQTDSRRVYIQRMAQNTQFFLKAQDSTSVASYVLKANIQRLVFTDRDNKLSVEIIKNTFESAVKIRGQTYASMRNQGTVAVGKLMATVNPSLMVIMFPGGTFYKQTNILQFAPGTCITLALPVFGAITQGI